VKDQNINIIYYLWKEQRDHGYATNYAKLMIFQKHKGEGQGTSTKLIYHGW